MYGWNLKGSGLRPVTFAAIALALGAIAVSCDDGGSGDQLASGVYSPQGEQLDVYNLETDAQTTLLQPETYVNGQVCPVPGTDGNFVVAEDKNAPSDSSKTGPAEREGWSIFSADGTLLQKIAEPHNEGEADPPEPYGCAFDSDERLFLSDVGSGEFGAEDGKLIVFFPGKYESYCILDSKIRTAGQIAIDDQGNVYLPESVPPGRVQRYAGPFPSNADECESVKPEKSVFIEDLDLNTPLGITRTPDGHWYVSSVLLPLPTIREYDENGKFVRVVVVGEKTTGDPIGNPAGIAVASDGTLYYADLGLEEKPAPQFYGPKANAGTVRKIAFDAQGNPMQPETLGQGLAFPDSVTVVE